MISVTNIDEIKNLIGGVSNMEWCCLNEVEGNNVVLIYRHGLLDVFDEGYNELEHNPYTDNYGIWDVVKKLGPTSLFLLTKENIEYIEIYGKVVDEGGFDYFVAERVGKVNGVISSFKKQTDQLLKLREWGFEIPQFKRCNSPEKVIEFCSRIAKGSIDHYSPTTAINISINDVDTVNEEIPAFFKYHIHQTVKTEIKGIQFEVCDLINVGDSLVEEGSVLPTILLKEACYIGGRYITELTIHHLDGVDIEEFCIGDFVTLRGNSEGFKATVTPNLNIDRSIHLHYPDNCDYCGKGLKRFEGERHPRCGDGSDCVRYKVAALKRLTGINGLAINGIGPGRIKNILRADIIKQPLDLFSLTVEDLCKVERIGKRAAEDIIHAIVAAKKTSLPQFLHAAGAPLLLGHYFKSLDEVLNATVEDITLKLQSNGYGHPYDAEEKGINYHNQLRKEKVVKGINDLLNVGVKIVHKPRYY